jgi:hypothetical protein
VWALARQALAEGAVVPVRDDQPEPHQ